MPLLLAPGSSEASCIQSDRIYIYASENITYTLVGQTDGQTGGRRASSTIHTLLIARYVEIPTAVRINGSPGNFMSPSKLRASTNIYRHLAEQKRVELVISLYSLLFICIKSLVVFLPFSCYARDISLRGSSDLIIPRILYLSSVKKTCLPPSQ
jgi:hypothetical protein